MPMIQGFYRKIPSRHKSGARRTTSWSTWWPCRQLPIGTREPHELQRRGMPHRFPQCLRLWRHPDRCGSSSARRVSPSSVSLPGRKSAATRPPVCSRFFQNLVQVESLPSPPLPSRPGTPPGIWTFQFSCGQIPFAHLLPRSVRDLSLIPYDSVDGSCPHIYWAKYCCI